MECAAKNRNSKFQQEVSPLPEILAVAWQLVTQLAAEKKVPKNNNLQKILLELLLGNSNT